LLDIDIVFPKVLNILPLKLGDFSPTNAIMHGFSTMQGSILCKISISKALLITVSAASASSFKFDTNGMLGEAWV
jgi:hypothetical protein